MHAYTLSLKINTLSIATNFYGPFQSLAFNSSCPCYQRAAAQNYVFVWDGEQIFQLFCSFTEKGHRGLKLILIVGGQRRDCCTSGPL